MLFAPNKLDNKSYPGQHLSYFDHILTAQEASQLFSVVLCRHVPTNGFNFTSCFLVSPYERTLHVGQNFSNNAILKRNFQTYVFEESNTVYVMPRAKPLKKSAFTNSNFWTSQRSAVEIVYVKEHFSCFLVRLTYRHKNRTQRKHFFCDLISFYISLFKQYTTLTFRLLLLRESRWLCNLCAPVWFVIGYSRSSNVGLYYLLTLIMEILRYLLNKLRILSYIIINTESSISRCQNSIRMLASLNFSCHLWSLAPENDGFLCKNKEAMFRGGNIKTKIKLYKIKGCLHFQTKIIVKKLFEIHPSTCRHDTIH